MVRRWQTRLSYWFATSFLSPLRESQTEKRSELSGDASETSESLTPLRALLTDVIRGRLLARPGARPVSSPTKGGSAAPHKARASSGRRHTARVPNPNPSAVRASRVRTTNR